MNEWISHLFPHYELNWARQPPENGEMNEMILPSRNRIRILSSATEALHDIESNEQRRNICFFETWILICVLVGVDLVCPQLNSAFDRTEKAQFKILYKTDRIGSNRRFIKRCTPPPPIPSWQKSWHEQVMWPGITISVALKSSKHNTITKCWANVADSGPTLSLRSWCCWLWAWWTQDVNCTLDPC